jgi:hypothetical protein
MDTSPPLSFVARLEVRVAIVVGLVGDVLSTADAINADLTLMPFANLRSAGVSAVKARDGCGLSDVPLAVWKPPLLTCGVSMLGGGSLWSGTSMDIRQTSVSRNFRRTKSFHWRRFEVPRFVIDFRSLSTEARKCPGPRAMEEWSTAGTGPDAGSRGQ